MCLTFLRCYLLAKMDQWFVDPCDPRNWYPNKQNLVIQLIQPLINQLEQSYTRAVCTFDYVIIGFILFFTRKFHRHWISGSMGILFWLKEEINGKRLIKVIRVIQRILLLPWIQWVMIHVIEWYEAMGIF